MFDLDVEIYTLILVLWSEKLINFCELELSLVYIAKFLDSQDCIKRLCLKRNKQTMKQNINKILCLYLRLPDNLFLFIPRCAAEHSCPHSISIVLLKVSTLKLDQNSRKYEWIFAGPKQMIYPFTDVT